MHTYWQVLWEELLPEMEDPERWINERMKILIDTNILVEGDQLPPLRLASRKWSVPERMIRRVYQALQKEEYVEILPSYGAFVAPRPKDGKRKYHWPDYDVIPVNEHPDHSVQETFHITTISAGFDYPNPKSFSMDFFFNYIQGVLGEYGAATKATIQQAIGTEFSKYIKSAYLLASPGQCTYVPTKEALSIVVRLTLMPGDIVVMDSPEDLAARMTFARLGLQVLFTGSDRYGMLTHKLEEYCLSHRVKAVFIRPPAGYPKNIHLSDKRRAELVRIGCSYDLTMIVNDDDHELWCGKPVLPVARRMHGGRLIYMGAISKASAVLSPYTVVAATPGITARIEDMVRLTTTHMDLAMALAAGRIANDSRFRNRVNKVKKENQKRLLEVLQLSRGSVARIAEVSVVRASLSLWIGFKNLLPADAVISLLSQFEIEVPGIYRCASVRADRLTGLRLGVTYIENERLVLLFEAFCTLLTE